MYIKEYTDLPPEERRQLNYKRRYKEECSTWDDSMVLLVNWLKDIKLDRPRLLDIGCGRGNFVVDELGGMWGEKVGFDVDSEATVGNVSMTRVVHGAADRLPFEDEAFDVVTSLWVLEHVQNPDQFVAEVKCVLRPGGIWVFVTPNKKSLLVKLRQLLHHGLAEWLVEKLYGRKERDTFPVFYRLNDVHAFSKYAKEFGLEILKLQENEDPSYTSFSGLSYRLSALFAKVGGSFARPHIAGIMRKI